MWLARHTLVTHERAAVARVMRYGGSRPNIVPLLERNLSGSIPWLMYEQVEGGALAEAVEGWRELPPPRRLGRAVKVLHAPAGALGTFRRFDPPLVQRDLKPQNVLMSHGTALHRLRHRRVATVAASRGSDPEVAATELRALKLPAELPSLVSRRGTRPGPPTEGRERVGAEAGRADVTQVGRGQRPTTRRVTRPSRSTR